MILDGSTYRVFIHIIDKWRIFFNNSFDHLEPWQIIMYTLSWIFLIQWIRKIFKYEETFSLTYSFKELLLNVPVIRKKHEEHKEKLQKTLDDKLLKYDTVREFYKFLPDRGLTINDIVSEATDYRSMSDLLFERGRMSGSTFTESDENHLNLLTKVFSIYCYTNAQFPDVYPACRKMEAEIIRMLCSLFHGGVKSCGTFALSSSESVLLTCAAYRNKAFKQGIRKPEIIVSENVSVSFYEAARTLGIRIIKLKLNRSYEADIGAIKRAISRETCLIVVSAPSPVFGTVDKIEEISQIALRYSVPLHVDAGYGGFLLPFMEQCDYVCPPFDFRVSGISSITVDLDKYGLCPVGASAVLYRDFEMLEYQTFLETQWPGGVYVNSTISDNRSGMQIALTWATLLHHGRHGYVEKTQLILDSSRTLLEKLKTECDGMIQILGEPTLSIITFTTTPGYKVPVHWLGDELNELGWNLTLQQNPDSLRLCICMNQTKEGVIDEFVIDIKKCIKKITTSLEESPPKVYEKTMGMYGLSSPLPDFNMKYAIAKMFVESYYSTPNVPNKQTRTLSIEGRKLSHIISSSKLQTLTLQHKEPLIPPKEE